MNRTMNCDEAQRAMDRAFDEGDTLPSSAAAHVDRCTVCNGYRDALAALDLKLSQAPPIQPAPALVARIQAQIATQHRPVLRPWTYPVAVAAAVCLLAALGPVVDGLSWLPKVESSMWSPRVPTLPEWGIVKQELAGIPAGVVGDLTALGRWSESAWTSLNGWLTAFGSGYNPWVWALFIFCLATAFALDGMEWLSRRAHRP
jgi:hypothetical protein